MNLHLHALGRRKLKTFITRTRLQLRSLIDRKTNPQGSNPVNFFTSKALIPIGTQQHLRLVPSLSLHADERNTCCIQSSVINQQQVSKLKSTAME
jgi:hypothetical protein